MRPVVQLRIYRFWDKAVGERLFYHFQDRDAEGQTPLLGSRRARTRVCVSLCVRFYQLAQGPHPTAMFEVNVFNPHQTGAFFSWLAVNRGPLS